MLQVTLTHTVSVTSNPNVTHCHCGRATANDRREKIMKLKTGAIQIMKMSVLFYFSSPRILHPFTGSSQNISDQDEHILRKTRYTEEQTHNLLPPSHERHL